MPSKEELASLQNEAAHIAAMMGSPGWLVMVDEANERKARLVTLLIDEDDESAKLKLQANIRGLNFLLRFPEELLETARRLNEEASPETDEDSSK